jgi:hypothetical protein
MSSESRIWEIRPFGSMRGESELVLGRWASQPNRSRLLYAKAWWRREGSGKNANEFIFGAMGFRRAGCMAHMRRRFWQARELPQSDGDLLSVLGTVGDL